MKEFSLIYYLNFGFPSLEASQDMVRYYATCGAQNLQLDLPTRHPDPTMENEFIMDRIARALEACGDYQRYLEAILQVKRELPRLQIEMTVYEETVAEVGGAVFTDFCKKAGITRVSWIPRREGADPSLPEMLRAGGLKLLHPVLFHLPQERVEEAVTRHEPVVLMLEGGGGEPYRPGCETLPGALRFLREQGVEGPICVTMGIRSPERVREVLEQGADGAYVGSRLIQAWEDRDELKRLIQEFEKAYRREAQR